MHSKNIAVPKHIFVFSAFIFLAILVNTANLFFNQDGIDFIVNNFQLLYAFLILIFFTIFFESKFLTDRAIGNILSFFLLLNIFLWSIGLGNYEYFPRYNGFLTDPNQFSFAVICCSFIAIAMFQKTSSRAFVWVMAGFLIVLSASRSGLIGFIGGTFLLLPNKLKLIAAIIGVVIFSSILIFVDSDLIYRFSSIDIIFEFWQRGFYRLIEFPQYLLFGVGKGMDERFGYNFLEIHSTPIAILFYYGLVPFILFYSCLLIIFKDTNNFGKALVFAMVLYSLTTYNIRTPVFWFALAASATCLRKDFNEKNQDLKHYLQINK